MKKKNSIYCIITILITINIWSLNQINASQKASIKGISTNNIQTPKSTPSPVLSTFPTPTKTLTNKISPPVIQPTTQAKQYGGWYWNPKTDKSQVWFGTDSTGKDIWADGFSNSSNSTNTAQEQSSQQVNSNGNQSGTSSQNTNTSGSSSTVTIGNNVGTINSSQSCSTDGSNPAIPKCP